MNASTKRREWIKNVAIIFLIVMLVLTFFSNTIMNYSLPEVATQYVQRGTITAKVRGTGNVEATDPYNVIVKETRTIASVAVKQGDEVEKDQVLYYLEDAESDELKKAEDELEELELAYMKGLFGSTVSPEIISKVSSGRTDSFAGYQAMVTDMQTRIDAAEARVKECQDAVNNISLQSTVDSNNAGVSTVVDELEKDDAATDLANAEASFNRWKEKRVAEIQGQISNLEKDIADLQVLVDNAESISGSVSGSLNPSPSPSANISGGIDSYIEQRDVALAVVKAKVVAINTAWTTKPDGSSTGNTGITIKDNPTINDLETNFKELYGKIGDKSEYESMYNEYYAAVSQYNITVKNFNSASENLSSYESNTSDLNTKKARLRELQSKLAEVNAITIGSNESAADAKKRLDQATRNITEITNANKQTQAAYANKKAQAEAALANAQAVLELLKTEQTELSADINAELDLSKTNKDIADKKEEIAKLKEKSMGAAVTAPVAGTVTSLSYVAGETTKPEEAAAVIQVAGKGFTLSFSVTNEQAKKVQVGDTAELQNSWYYEDVQAILSAIKPDPESQGQKKLLVFDVTGTSIQAGQALNLSVGQRSSEYELVVPNSAIREDSNGKFILTVESKSSPLGNRYIATRVDVEVLASDDNNTAVSAGLYGYEYVITTSTKPVEAGKQVRLNES